MKPVTFPTSAAFFSPRIPHLPGLDLSRVRRIIPSETYLGSVYHRASFELDGLPLALFRDTSMTSAGNKKKYRLLKGLGRIRTDFHCRMMELLQPFDIPSAHVARVGPEDVLQEDTDPVPGEFIVRLRALGSIVEVEGVPLGTELDLVHVDYKGSLDCRDPANLRLCDTHAIKQGEGDDVAGIYPDPHLVLSDSEPGMAFIYDAKAKKGAPALWKGPSPIDPKTFVECCELARKIARAIDHIIRSLKAANVDPTIIAMLLGDIKFEFGRRKRDGVLVMIDFITPDVLRWLIDRGDSLVFNVETAISKDPFRRRNLPDDEMAFLMRRRYQLGVDLLRAAA